MDHHDELVELEDGVVDAITDRDDVAEFEETLRLDAETFDSVRENVEVRGRDCWVGALVRDEAGRIALVRNRWSDGWVLPGGKVEPGETLCDAVVREVREETGLAVEVGRPLEVVEQTFVHREESTSGHFVVVEARADGDSFGDDLGEVETEIEEAAWFAEVPDRCENEDRLHRYFQIDG